MFTLSQAGKQLGITFSTKERRKGETVLEGVPVTKSLLHILHFLKVSFIPVTTVSPGNNITHPLGKLRALLSRPVSLFLKSYANRKQTEN